MARLKRLIKLARHFPPQSFIFLSLGVFAFLVFKDAWVSEDAYITFRVMENFMDGYGLRWNIAERVQVYTHPLWMLLHLPFFAIWDNLFHVSIFLSILCTTAALAVVLISIDKPLPIKLGLFLVPLALSKSFMDYTSSGLETPLCYLIFASFGFVLLRMREHRHFWFYCSFTVALALCTRLDVVLIYIPILCYLVLNDWKFVRWRQIFLGATPLILWFCFAVFYYGFLFPNTKYAKLDTGLPLSLYIIQSLNYLKHLLILDTPGFIILCSSLWFVFRKNMLAACIGAGVYAYTVYVIYIGGDYMAGRFWAFPIFVSVWLWYVFSPANIRLDLLFASLCILGSLHLVSPMFRDINRDCENCLNMKGKIINATRTFHRNRLVLDLYPLKLRDHGTYPFCAAGKKLAHKKPPVEVMFFVGMHAYCAGPHLKAIDMLGLGDALIARLPAIRRKWFYIGHFKRHIPKGYKHAVDTGFTTLMDPSLAKYYEKLKIITRGDLLDKDRLKTIVLFNLGYYDHWRQEYLNAK